MLATKASRIKLEFHDADIDTETDILARILADTSYTRDLLKLFLWQAERHADILATIRLNRSRYRLGAVLCETTVAKNRVLDGVTW